MVRAPEPSIPFTVADKYPTNWLHQPPRGLEAAFSSFAAPMSGDRAKSKSRNVRVVARIRPLSEGETDRGCKTAVEPMPPPHEEERPEASMVLPSSRSTNTNEEIVKGTSRFDTPPKARPSFLIPPRLGAFTKTPIRRNTTTERTTTTPIRKHLSTTSENTISRSDSFRNLSDTTMGNAQRLTAGEKEFEFDAVFGPSASQKEVYERSVGDAVRRNIFQGYNTTIIAYGQTGAGKTYTMKGSYDEDAKEEDEVSLSKQSRQGTWNIFSRPSMRKIKNTEKRSNQDSYHNELDCIEGKSAVISDEDGVIPRAVHDLFKAKQRHATAGEVSISLTYIEIYNDELHDLLRDEEEPENLGIRDSFGSGVVVNGLNSVAVHSPTEVEEYMERAEQRRTIGRTAVNSKSSRSHTICTLRVTINPAVQVIGANLGKNLAASEIVSAKLTLVDLAGSERLKKTMVQGASKKESININKDLFVLGKVVKALADRSQTKSGSKVHIPYRDSKLTRLLRDSLGGNCCTVMVACISPATQSLEESMNTLRYAERTRAITNSVKQNAMRIEMTPEECAAMRRENKILKRKLKDLMKRMKAIEDKSASSSSKGACRVDDDSGEKLFNDQGESVLAGSISWSDTSKQETTLEKEFSGTKDKQLTARNASIDLDDDGTDTSTLTFDEWSMYEMLESSEKSDDASRTGRRATSEKLDVSEPEVENCESETDKEHTEKKRELDAEIKERKALRDQIEVEALALLKKVDALKIALVHHSISSNTTHESSIPSDEQREMSPVSFPRCQNEPFGVQNQSLAIESASLIKCIDSFRGKFHFNESGESKETLQDQFEERFKAQQDELTREVASLEASVKELEGKRKDMEDMVLTTETQVRDKRQQLEELDATISERSIEKEAIQELEEKAATLKNQIESLSSEQRELNDEVSNLRNIVEVSNDLNDERNLRREHEKEITNLKTGFESISSECDALRVKNAVQEDELQKLRDELAALRKPHTEIEVLTQNSNDLKQESRQEVASITKTEISNEQNDTTQLPVPASHDDDNVSVLFGKESITSCGIDHETVSSKSDHSTDQNKISTNDTDSVKSDHDAIRLHAAKMLFWANKAIEKTRGSGGSLASRSVASSIGTYNIPPPAALAPSNSATNGSSLRDPRLPPRISVPVKRMPAQRDSFETISNIDDKENIHTDISVMRNQQLIDPRDIGKIVGGGPCSCMSSVFSGGADHVEFFLPRLGMACSCGKNKTAATDGGDPTSLANILRPWQVEFLAQLGITEAEQFVKATNKNMQKLSSAMRQWRRQKKMKSIKTKSCAIALHIWARTCKVIVRSVRQQRALGVEQVSQPSFLRVSVPSDNRSVSTLGCGSLIGESPSIDVESMMEV